MSRSPALLSLALSVVLLAVPGRAGAATGDLNLDNDTNVADLQCLVLTSLKPEPPSCLKAPAAADINCDKSTDIVDVQLLVLVILADPKNGIPPDKDKNGNNVHDACEICVPKCAGMECGDDGCGSTCGTCPAGKVCQSGTCGCTPVLPVMEIGCGDAIPDSTQGPDAMDVYDSYPDCVSWNETGPEMIYLFTPECTADAVIFELAGPSADFDLFLANASGDTCTDLTCLAYSGGTLAAPAIKGESHYLIVDGYGGASGTYTLHVTCNCIQEKICGDGKCDTGEDSCNCKADCPLPAGWSCATAKFADGVCDCDCSAADSCDCNPSQCLPVCGDGFCDASETCGSCSQDCPCFCGVNGTVSCGGTLDATTWGHSNAMGKYSCIYWDESGPEYVAKVTPYCTGKMTAKITKQAGGELDVFILSACNANTCLGYGDSSASANVSKGIPYFVVVDGSDGTIGDFSLSVSCECQQDAKCAPAGTVACDATFSGNTAGANTTDLLDKYLKCSEWLESGPEQTLSFTPKCTGIARLSLQTEEDLDLFLLDADLGCTPDACLAAGAIQIVFDVTAQQPYYAVVDGYMGAAGAYKLKTECFCGADHICGDGACDADETTCNCAADCFEPAGWICPLSKWDDGVCDCNCGVLDACDCAPEQCQAPCSLAGTIACGDTKSGDTAGGLNNIKDHKCTVYAQSGPDHVYELTPGCTGIATATLTPAAGKDLDVAFLTGCEGKLCDVWGDTTAKAYVTSGKKVYVAVDGFNAAAGSYTLNVACQCGPQPSCGDGVCSGGETRCTCAADCFDALYWTCDAAWWKDGFCDCSCGRNDECDCLPGACGNICGDGKCVAGAGESACTCLLDCPIPSGWTCPKTMWDNNQCDAACGVADACDC